MARAGEHGDGVGQDRAAALRRLPRAYSLALRLRDAGVGGALIAECLDIEPEALSPMLLLAEAKLAAAERESAGQPPVP